MLSLLNIWTSFQSYVNTFQGSWYRPNTDFQPAVNDISKLIWESWTGQAEKSQEIKDHLSPFLITKPYTVTPSSGSFGYLEQPKDYGRFSAARILVHNGECLKCAEAESIFSQEEVNDKYFDKLEQAQVDLVDDQKWGACLTHLTKKPSLKKPKMTQVVVGGKNGWNVAPRKVSAIVLDYYTRPKEGTFVYTITPGNTTSGDGDFLQYDAVKSEQLQWPETVINEFIWRLGERFGLFTRDQFIAAFSTQQKQIK